MKIKTNINKLYYKPNKSKKPLIVFIAGAGCDHTLWAYQNRYYQNRGYSTYAINLPGHGNNIDKPISTIEKMALYILSNLKKLKKKEYILISHSMGTLISIYLVANNLLKVKKMILIGASLPMKVSGFLLNLAKKDQNLAINHMINWSLGTYSLLSGGQLIGTSLQNYLFSVMKNSQKGSLFKDLNACNNFKIKEELFKEIQTPTCFISGNKDIMTPASESKKLSDKFSNTEFNTINNCGHFHIFEYPNRVRNIISKFIGE